MMTRTISAVFVLLLASPAAAADRTHQQIMADIRMLQEQQQQLQQMIGGLAETLKVIASQIDEQTGATRKAFADQKLLVDGIAEGVRILREKADDTNVRLSTMNQELEAMRQTVAAMPPPQPSQPPVDPNAPDAPPGTPPAPAAPANVSPTQAWDAAWNDYTSGQYDLAVAGFEYYLRTFPMSPLAGEAQVNIGNSYYLQGSYAEAITAYQRAIEEYPQSPAVPQAYFKLGQSYEATKQLDQARRAYESVIKNHPGSPDATLARQRLDSLTKKEN